MDSEADLSNLIQSESDARPHTGKSESDRQSAPQQRQKSQTEQTPATHLKAYEQLQPQPRGSVRPREMLKISTQEQPRREVLPVVEGIIVIWVLAYVLLLLCFRWPRLRRYRWKMFVWVLISLIAVIVCYRVTIWPMYLLAELSMVILGLVAGWCLVDFDRQKVLGAATIVAPRGAKWFHYLKANLLPDPGEGEARKALDKTKDLDQLGFFNSRIAVRSPELFEVSIADIPGTEEQKKEAVDLVRSYWEQKQDNAGTAQPPEENPAQRGGGGNG